MRLFKGPAKHLGIQYNSICNFYQKLGQHGQLREAFYNIRASKVIKDHHIVIDGTLKQVSSKVNNLSAFSYKAKKKGYKEISVLSAYDIKAMETICAQVFPGNSIDSVSYHSFIKDNDIRKGIIIADKGFPPSSIKEDHEERPDMYFITSIKRNDRRIRNNNMLDFDGLLTGFDDHIIYKKFAIKGGRYLYAYQSENKARTKFDAYMSRRGKEKDWVY